MYIGEHKNSETQDYKYHTWLLRQSCLAYNACIVCLAYNIIVCLAYNEIQVSVLQLSYSILT